MLSTTKTLSNLPEDSINFSNTKVKFENIKEIAICRIGNVMNSKFDFVLQFDKCEYQNLETLSKNIFNWCYKEFIKRRELKNCIWIDVLKKYLQDQSLEKFKIQIDLKEIKRFLNLIFESFKQNINLDIMKALRDLEKYLNIYHILQDEQIMLREILQDHQLQINARLLEKRKTKQQFILWNIENTMLNAQTWDPIQMRYEINWYQSKTEQIHFKNILLENDVQQEITKYKFKILREELSGDNMRDTYYALAEQYKHNIDVLQRRYDNEVEDIDNQLNYTRLRISKLLEKIEFYKETIEQFHEEIRITLEKTERNQKDEEMKRK